MTLRKQRRLRFGALDPGGSGVAGYELTTRGADPAGAFSLPETVYVPVVAGFFERQASDRSMYTVPTPSEGYTVCASVRAIDGAGNPSAWTKETCTTRPLDELDLKAHGK